jgi:hypothetical protein
MGRRCRHISYKALGADLAYDARLIAANDGDPVSSVTDLSGNGWTASQGTSGERPTFRTGANGINGTPAITFDGTDDNMTHSYAQPGSGGDQCEFTVAQGISGTAAAGYAYSFCSSPPSTTVTLLPSLVFNNVDTRTNGGTGTTTGVAGTTAAVEMYHYQSGTLATDVNGTRASTSGLSPYAGDSNERRFLGAGLYTGGYKEITNAKLGAVLAFGSALSVPMRRRISHALCRSFKIPYS